MRWERAVTFQGELPPPVVSPSHVSGSLIKQAEILPGKQTHIIHHGQTQVI